MVVKPFLRRLMARTVLSRARTGPAISCVTRSSIYVNSNRTVYLLKTSVPWVAPTRLQTLRQLNMSYSCSLAIESAS